MKSGTQVKSAVLSESLVSLEPGGPFKAAKVKGVAVGSEALSEIERVSPSNTDRFPIGCQRGGEIFQLDYDFPRFKDRSPLEGAGIGESQNRGGIEKSVQDYGFSHCV